MHRSALTRDWILVKVQSLRAPGNAPVVLDAQPVSIAVVDTGTTPATLDWQPAEWVGDTGTKRVARAMFGPGSDLYLAPGAYQVWARVDGTTWLIAEAAYELTVT